MYTETQIHIYTSMQTHRHKHAYKKYTIIYKQKSININTSTNARIHIYTDIQKYTDIQIRNTYTNIHIHR